MGAKRESDTSQFGEEDCKEKGPDGTLILILLRTCGPFPFSGVCVFVEKQKKNITMGKRPSATVLKSNVFMGNLVL